jgi:hypothetical protein
MQPLLQLHLQSNSEKAEAVNLPNPEGEEREPAVVRKSLIQMANKAAHRAATEYRRNSSGLFSK